MFVPFNTINPASKIWIYQADKSFKNFESDIQKYLEEYCNRWAAHGHPLKASFDLRYGYFIIVAVDEAYNATSGCSVDDSVRAIKQIEQITQISFFNRNLIALLKNHEVQLLELKELKQKFTEGIWNEHTLAFNNLVNQKNQLDTDWVKPAGDTWLKRYIVRETVKS